MRIVLAGASGLIGTALRASLAEQGHAVTSLVRRAPHGPGESQWEPDAGRVDAAVLSAADAVVCLSGAGVADRRWTDAYKQTLRSSRLDTVGTLARAVATHGPARLLAASAVGYYGDTGDTEVDETSPSGDGFLAELCRDWEAATEPAERAGVAVAHLRTGIVLTARGGLLKRLLPIVRLGAGGRLGSGRQFLPWITLADEVHAITHLLGPDSAEITGAVNLVGPAPARNAEFVSALASVVHRPAVLPVPAFAIRIALGELAQDALGGQRAVPTALARSGFAFEHATLDSALRWAVRDR